MGGLHGKIRGACVGALVLIFGSGQIRAAVSAADVDNAIDKGIEFLHSRQQLDGSWETAPIQPAGPGAFSWGADTALASCAILRAGESSLMPSMKRAIDWLTREDLHGTYAIGVRSQVWGLIPYHMQSKSKAIVATRDHDRDFLLFSRIRNGPNAGFYGVGYGTPLAGGIAGFAPLDPKGPPTTASYDRFNSDAAVLGMWALDQAGAEVPMDYWKDEYAAWKNAQLANGGWNFDPGAPGASYPLTCAGVSTLLLAQQFLLRLDAHQFDQCNGGTANKEVEQGLAWIDRQIAPALDIHAAPNMYGLHAIARVGIATRRKYLGGIDWYKAGSEIIVRNQHADGGWGSIRDTAFAMLFLEHGRAPVMMNKLVYELPNSKQAQPWNERPRDVENLARWMGPHLCSFLNWQTTRLASPADDLGDVPRLFIGGGGASARADLVAPDLHDAPILYISGSESLAFKDSEIVQLRIFIEEGGLILGNADCGHKEFTDSFMRLGKTLFPKYEFRKLSMDHPIFEEMYHGKKWKRIPEVQAISNGVRELLLFSPDTDMGRDWQVESVKLRESSYQLATNIFIYAAGKENLRANGESDMIRPQGPAGREIRVARIKVGDNWDPEPGAWRRLSALLHNEQKIDVKPEAITLGSGKLADYKIAALTGTTVFTLAAGQRREIKQFVDNGGTLIIDSAGGGSQFADCAQASLKEVFGEAAAGELKQPLPMAHAIYNAPAPVEIRYRRFARQSFEGGATEPRIRGISVGGRTAVFFSREDITAGLVPAPADGILGYTPEVASRLMCNIIAYADKNK